jgi:hypothetical protein
VTVAATGQGSNGRPAIGFTAAIAAFWHEGVAPTHEWLPPDLTLSGMPGMTYAARGFNSTTVCRTSGFTFSTSVKSSVRSTTRSTSSFT